MKTVYCISLLLLMAGCKKEVSPYFMKASANGTEYTFGKPVVDFYVGGRIKIRASGANGSFLELNTKGGFVSTEKAPQTLDLTEAVFAQTNLDVYSQTDRVLTNLGKLIITSTGNLEAEGTFQMRMKGNPDLMVVGSFKTHL